MKFFKRNVILSFAVFMFFLSVGFGVLGYFASDMVRQNNAAMAELNWSMEPSGDYGYLKHADEDNLFWADAITETHLIDPTGKIVKKLPAGEELGHGYYEYEQDGLYGVADESGNILIEPEYDFVNGGGDYFITSDEDYRVAFWKLDGACIHKEDQPSSAYDLGDNTFLVAQEQDGKSYIFYADTGKSKPLSDYITYVLSDDQGGVLGEIAGLYYHLDENFEVVEDAPIYDNYRELSEGLRFVSLYDEPTGNVTPCYVDEDGKVVISFGGADPDTAGPFREGKALIQQQSRLICIDKEGKELFSLKLKSSSSGIRFYDEFYYSEGLAAVSLDGDKYGYIDETGEFVVPAVLDWAGEVKGGYAAAAVYGSEYQYGILKFD